MRKIMIAGMLVSILVNGAMAEDICKDGLCVSLITNDPGLQKFEEFCKTENGEIIKGEKDFRIYACQKTKEQLVGVYVPEHSFTLKSGTPQELAKHFNF